MRRPGVTPSLPSVPGVARSELSSSAVEACSVVDAAGGAKVFDVANGLSVVELELELPNPN